MFCRWEFVERHRKAKFDAIADGHAAALMAMGVLKGTPEREVKGPELPDDMAHVVDHYRHIKFSFCQTDGTAVLTPRKALQFTEVESYARLIGVELKPFEVSLIMDIDGIFESRGD